MAYSGKPVVSCGLTSLPVSLMLTGYEFAFWPVAVGPKASNWMPRPSGHWRMVLFVTVAVIVHVPCWVIWMPVPSCEPEFAVPAVPMMLLSMNIFIVPRPAAPETKLTAWLFVPWRLLLTKRTYMLGDPVPPPLAKLGPMPRLFVDGQPGTGGR